MSYSHPYCPTLLMCSRKAAKTAHPDVGGSEEKMATLNEAYEVLSSTGKSPQLASPDTWNSANDPELRQRYDNGDDPNDPTSGQQHNPFANHGGGGMPFQFFQQGGGGGGPFQGGQRFKFEF